jgi:phospholipid/cholesterol/gamma-HCH transport system substrate-binding protein
MGIADNKRSVTVGIFVFLALAIFVTGVLVLGGKQKRFVKSISVRTVFDDVAGLQPGNNVWFSGVKIGTVKKINFYGTSQVEISMNIEQDVQKYIRKDAVALISSESLIGNKIIEIQGGSQGAPPVADGDVLKAGSSVETDDIMETLQANNKNLLAITTDFKKLSSKISNGEGTVGALLTDTTLAQSLNAIVASLQQVSNNTVRASGALTQFTRKLNTDGGLANELLTDTLVFSKLKTSIEQLEQTTSSAADMTNDLKKASNQLNTSNNAVGVFLNDEEFATKLKTTIGNLETSTEKLDENMEALQHNFLLRGFFRKKAKREAKEQAGQ